MAYLDQRRPKGPASKLTTTARMITDGNLSCTDAEYQKEVTAVHVGERLYLKVVDADLDRTNERDKAKVVITSKRGEKEVVELIETLAPQRHLHRLGAAQGGGEADARQPEGGRPGRSRPGSATRWRSSTWTSWPARRAARSNAS